MDLLPACIVNLWFIGLVICHGHLYRHPKPSIRPQFSDMVVALQQPDFQILKWTQTDIATFDSENARVLGSLLEEGHCLYHDLQFTYKSSDCDTCDNQPQKLNSKSRNGQYVNTEQ